MKKIICIILCLTIFSSCEDDTQIVGGFTEDSYFKITEFIIAETSIDLNNDNISNIDMFDEFSNYFNNTYDLQIKTNNNSSLFSFYIPKQNIFSDYLCCPNGYVEFVKNGFTINLDKNQTIIDNLIIDNETKIISFSKIGNTSYKLILEKKYYAFNSSSFSNEIYELKYDIIN